MKKQCHPYYLMNCWNSIDSVVSHLVNSVIYHKDGLIVVNKPYGLMQAVVKTMNRPGIAKGSLNTSAAGGNSYSLQEVLQYVASGLGCRALHVVRMPERYESGVGILASTDAAAEKVRQCFKRAKPLQRPTRTYWGVVVGVPQPESADNRFGVKLKMLPDGDKQAVLTEEWSRASVGRGDVRVADVRHRMLSTDPGRLASLVEVATSTTKWHFVRLYLSYLLSPVLGDNLLGSRVATVLGRKVLLPPGNDATKLPQTLSSEVMNLLRLQQGWEVMVPVHLHLRQLTLVGYLGKGKDLCLEAPVPPVFQLTCDWLQLQIPDNVDAGKTLAGAVASSHGAAHS